MKKYFLPLFIAFFVTTGCYAQSKKEMQQLIHKVMKLGASQYKLLEKNTSDSLMPRYFDPVKRILVPSDTKWWCSGFFPGTLWYLYEYTKDESLRTIAEKRLQVLEQEKYFTGNHDLGFMIFCSFGNAYRITNDSIYKDAVMTAAASLATRYRPQIRSIQSWNSSERLLCPVIIDNMMNLELLYWVSDNGGDAQFRDIAITHANSTLQNHFRSDGSSYHVLDYDLITGQIVKKLTWQGAHDSSAWARGQAWGLYGFTMMYRFSKDSTYLSQARKIAQFVIHHVNMPKDKIPYWDFDAPGIPNTYRDASSAAIMASAFLELARYVDQNERDQLLRFAKAVLISLGSSQYLSQPGENGGFLLKHSVGSLPHKGEVDVSLTYADYYLVEALLRYKNWWLGK